MVLWALASIALLLLAYEVQTLAVAVFWPLIQNPSALQTDFHYYYEAAQRFALDPNRLYLASDDVIAGFAYPPLGILPFVLLSSMLPLGWALMVLTAISYSVLIAAVWLWSVHLGREGFVFSRRKLAATMLIVFVLGPTYANATFGQVNALVLVSCVAFLVWRGRAPALAGLCLAAGAWLKVYPILMVAVGAWDRRAWRAIAATVAAGVLLAALALPIVPISAHRAFLGDVLPARIDKTAIHVSNQSLVAFLERFRYPSERFRYWTGEQAVTVNAAVRIIGWTAGLAALFALWKRGSAGGQAAVVSEASLMALVAVIAPLGWSHTYVLVLPLVALRLLTLGRMEPAAAVTTACCILALMVPAGRLFPFADQWPDWSQNLIYSRYLIATVLLALLPLGKLPPLVEQVRS